MALSLYEQDALAWAEHQADLLRRLALGERVNDAIDWPNVIEEVQDVGLSELRACGSLLRQALIHLIKLHALPDSTATGHWRGEVVVFLSDARDRFTPSMAARLDLAALYAQARKAVQAEDAALLRAVPMDCPFQLHDLLGPDADPATLQAALGGATAKTAARHPRTNRRP